MPEDKIVPQPRDINLEDTKFEFVRELIPDLEALSLVTKTFDKYSGWRTRSHDPRWQDNDRLYHGWVPQETWPGTKIKKSALPVQIAFDQVEAIYPILTSEIFGQRPFWFSVGATQESTPQEAFQLQAALAFQLDTPWQRDGISAKQHIKLAAKQYLQHGNGVVEIGFDPRNNSLFVDWTDLRDLYLDPHTSTPWLDSSPAVIRRKMIRVDEIASFREVPGYKIPSDPTLNFLSKSTPVDPSQQTKDEQAAIVGESSAQTEQPVNPSDRTIELLMYWSDRRLIWVLGRKWIALNVENPYGFKPFCMAPLFVVLGRIYAQSIPDVIEGDQKYIQGIVNARLNELSLALNPPRVRARNLSESSSQASKWGPGVEITVDSPDQIDIQVPSNITDNAYVEVSLAERRVEKRLGISSLQQTGVPTPSNANRTGQGVGAQKQASSTRQTAIIENFEDFLIVPLLYKSQKILSMFLPIDQPVPGIGADGQVGQVPRESLNSRVRFKMDAAARMNSRAELQQIIGPVTQTLFGEPVLNMLKEQGQTVDMPEWIRLFTLATGTHETFNLLRPMNEQEQQAAQQPPPEVLAEQESKQLEAQTRIQMGQMKAQSELQKAQIEAESKADETAEKSGREILKTFTQDQSNRDVNREKLLAQLLQAVINSKAKDKESKAKK